MAEFPQNKRLLAQVDRRRRNLLGFAEGFGELCRWPEALVEREGEGTLAALPVGTRLHLYYEFPDLEGLRRHFGPLFDRLEPQLTAIQRYREILLDLDDRPSRQWVEPVLRGRHFLPVGDWAVFAVLASQTPRPQPPGGVTVRPARATDAAGIATVVASAYGDEPLSEEEQHQLLGRSPWTHVAEAGGEVVGYAQAERRPGLGLVGILAVEPAWQRRGVGAALLGAAGTWARDQGLRLLGIRFRIENPGAVALAKRFGMGLTGAGVTFRRTLDPGELTAMLRRKRGAYVRFVGYR